MHNRYDTCSEVEQGQEGVGGRMDHRGVWSADLTEKVDLSSTVKEGSCRYCSRGLCRASSVTRLWTREVEEQPGGQRLGLEAVTVGEAVTENHIGTALWVIVRTC